MRMHISEIYSRHPKDIRCIYIIFNIYICAYILYMYYIYAYLRMCMSEIHSRQGYSYVYRYIYMCVYISICIYIHIHVYIYTYIYILIYIHLSMYICIKIYSKKSVRIWSVGMCAEKCTCVVYSRTCRSMRACMYM